MLHSQRPERLTTSYYSLPEKDVFGLTQTPFITLVPKKTSDKQYKFTSKGVDPSLCAYRTNVAKKIQRCAERDAVYFPTKKRKDSARDQLFNGVLISSQDFALEVEEHCKWFNTDEVRLTVLMCSTTESPIKYEKSAEGLWGHADDKRSSAGWNSSPKLPQPNPTSSSNPLSWSLRIRLLPRMKQISNVATQYPVPSMGKIRGVWPVRSYPAISGPIRGVFISHPNNNDKA